MEERNTFDVKLFNSSVDGNLERVMAALAHGGRVAMRNSQGYTPLIAAAYNGHADIFGLLLAHGSDVNDMDPNTKHTALEIAALFDHEATVEAIPSWGAVVDPQDNEGFTPLHSA